MLIAITQDVRRYHAEQGVTEGEAVRRGLEEKRKNLSKRSRRLCENVVSALARAAALDKLAPGLSSGAPTRRE